MQPHEKVCDENKEKNNARIIIILIDQFHELFLFVIILFVIHFALKNQISGNQCINLLQACQAIQNLYNFSILSINV